MGTHLCGPVGSRRSTTDRASEYQLWPTRASSAEAKKTSPPANDTTSLLQRPRLRAPRRGSWYSTPDVSAMEGEEFGLTLVVL
jgi:hypothetical protein